LIEVFLATPLDPAAEGDPGPEYKSQRHRAADGDADYGAGG
jgi:hypothetical protein